MRRSIGANTLVACVVICIDSLSLHIQVGRDQFKDGLLRDIEVGGGEAGFLQETDPPPQTGREDTLSQCALWLPYQVS